MGLSETQNVLSITKILPAEFVKQKTPLESFKYSSQDIDYGNNNTITAVRDSAIQIAFIVTHRCNSKLQRRSRCLKT